MLQKKKNLSLLILINLNSEVAVITATFLERLKHMKDIIFYSMIIVIGLLALSLSLVVGIEY